MLKICLYLCLIGVLIYKNHRHSNKTRQRIFNKLFSVTNVAVAAAAVVDTDDDEMMIIIRCVCWNAQLDALLRIFP